MIADTTFLIDLLSGKKEASNFVKHNLICTTSISVFEIFQGLKESEISKVNNFLEEIIVLNFDLESGIIAGNILKTLRKTGFQVDPLDCMIAAIAINKNLPVVTRNIKHFSRFNELKLIEY